MVLCGSVPAMNNNGVISCLHLHFHHTFQESRDSPIVRALPIWHPVENLELGDLSLLICLD